MGSHVLSQKDTLFLYFLPTDLFPCVEQNYGVLLKRFRKLLLLFELVCEWEYLPRSRLRSVGRSLAHRVCLARSFLTKMALNIPMTSGLRERLLSDVLLRSLCGWSRPCDVPSAPTFDVQRGGTHGGPNSADGPVNRSSNPCIQNLGAPNHRSRGMGV